MLEATRILGYLADAADLGGGPDVSFDDGNPAWALDMDTARSGALGVDLTKSVFAAYSARYPDVAFGERKVPLVLGACLLSGETHDDAIPLLLVPVQLGSNGALLPVEGARPWIPQRMLGLDNLRSTSLPVCDLDTYRAHQLSMASLAQGDAWSEVFARALDLFEAISSLKADELASAGLHVDLSCCKLRIWEHDDAHLCAAHALRAQQAALAEYGPDRLSPSLAATLQLHSGDDDEGDHDHLPDDDLLVHKLVCGMPEQLSLLTVRDREIVAALAQHVESGLAVVDAPKGTNALPVALATMANLVTEHALRGDGMPSMCLVAPPDRIDAMLAPFANRSGHGQTSLPVRWLPRVATSHSSDASDTYRHVLGPLPALFMLHTTDAWSIPAHPAALTQPHNHPLGGTSLPYTQSWYLPQASTYYLDCVSGFLGKRVRNLHEASVLLSERLRIVDQLRCELVDAYFEVCRADDHMRRRDELVRMLGILRRRHTACRARLGHWDEVRRRHPQRLAKIGGIKVDQTALIARSALEGENHAQDASSVEEVCARYRDELSGIESEIDRIRSASAQLSRRVRAAQPEGERCSRIVSRLTSLCRMSVDQASLIDAAVDGSEVSLERLDHILDQTVRPAEFWLALHVYEARWLDMARKALTEEPDGTTRSLDWDVWAALCPLSLMTPECAQASLSGWGFVAGPSEAPTSETRRLDMLVVLDAHDMDPVLGMALMGATNKACVIGSASELRGEPLNGPTFEELRGARYWKEEWDEAKREGLALAGSSSLFDLLLAAPDALQAELVDDTQGGEALCDLRVKVIDASGHSHGVLRSAAPLLSSEVYEVIPAHSYVLVPDSSWVQLAASRTNHAQALALMRWLERHLDELALAIGTDAPSLGLVATTHAQAGLLASLLDSLPCDHRDAVEVCALHDVAGRRWPVVVWDTVCGPDALRGVAPDGLARIAGEVCACATMALVMFVSQPWTKSADKVARALMGDATCIGRLFSVARKRSTANDSRTKPLALTTLLKRLKERGDIEDVPSTSSVNAALAREGLIERCRDEEGNSGWRPTTAGKEVGIMGTSDHAGNPFCRYARASEAVVARVVAEISE